MQLRKLVGFTFLGLLCSVRADAADDRAYTCIIEQRMNSRIVSTVKLSYDRGKFREERISPQTGKVVSIHIYNRDGQGLSYRYRKLKPPTAGVDLSGILHRQARDNPEELLRSRGLNPKAKAVVPEPHPEFHPLPVTPDRLQKYYRKIGQEKVAGQICGVYTGGNENLYVWDSLILRADRLSAGRPFQEFELKRLTLVESLPKVLFELSPGTTLKAPRDFHVKVPRGVKLIEYAGNGIRMRKRESNLPGNHDGT